MNIRDFYSRQNVVKSVKDVEVFPARSASFTPVAIQTYTLQNGEDLFYIADKLFGSGAVDGWEMLAELNPYKHPDDWKSGDVVKIPELIALQPTALSEPAKISRRDQLLKLFRIGRKSTAFVTPSCPVPSNIVSTPTLNGALFSWSADSAVYCIVDYKIGVAGAVTSVSVFGTSKEIANPDYAGETIYFRVRSVCLYSSTSAYTDWATYTVPASYPACATITNIAAEPVSASSANVDITSVPNAYTLGYTLMYRAVGDLVWLNKFIPANYSLTGIALINLNAGVEYEIKAKSLCRYNGQQYDGADSSIVTITQPLVIPTITGFVVDAANSDNIVTSWNAAGGVTNYRVWIRSVDGTYSVQTTTANTTFTFTGLTPNRLYNVYVAAIVNSVVGTFAQILNVRTAVNVCSVPILASIVELPGTTSGLNKYRNVRVTVLGGFNTTAYKWTFNSANVPFQTGSVLNLSFEDNDWNATTVEIGCKAICGNSMSSEVMFSLNLTEADPSVIYCPLPTIGQINFVSLTTIDLVLGSIDALLKKVAVQYRVAGTSVWFGGLTEYLVVNGTVNVNDLILQASTFYEVRIKAICSVDDVTFYESNGYSGVSAFQTGASVPEVCNVVIDVQVSQVTNNSALVRWVQQPNSTGYSIRVTKATTNEIVIDTVLANVSEFALTGLEANMIYYVEIKTLCAFGESPYCEYIPFQTSTFGGGGGGGAVNATV